MNESASRILDKNVYTRVSAQLIGADEWKQDRIEPHLFDTRSSRESGNGQILYYNEGTGFGYCHCTKCGKTVLESWPAASSSDPEKLPFEMNTIQSKDSDKPDYHFSLVRKGFKPSKCLGCGNPDYIKRNVVLGDTIQTDYTEIRIRHFQKDWINSRSAEEDLLITLGLLFARALAEELNVERTDLDFTITPTGHICIFDANPGGSGYSNQLAAMDLMKDVIERASGIVEAAEQSGNKEALIDKFTLHYLNHIDIKAARAWIDEERSARKVLPDAVTEVFGAGVTETSLVKMERAFALSQDKKFIFVDDDYANWEYEGTDHCWKGQFFNYFAPHGQETAFCVARNTDAPMSVPVINMIRSVKGWANEVMHIQNPFAKKGLYPLAYIDGRLYFINNPNHITMNDKWGNGTIYYLRTNNFASEANIINTDVETSTTKIFKLGDGDPTVIKTSELAGIIDERAESLVSDFVAHCRAHVGETVQISYQDEHLKSILSIILCLQTIGYFVRKIGLPFSLEFHVEQYSDVYGRRDYLNTNQPTFEDRDKWLKKMTSEFIEDMRQYEKIDGTFVSLLSVPRRRLPHWRVLTLECAGKKLCIYPDGGFMNGWFIDKSYGRRYIYDPSEINCKTEIKLFRNQEIKFDVTIEDC